MSDRTLSKADFVSGNDVRWCPGCGDYAILNVVQRILPQLGIKRENIVFVSGIGCSSRFPYYMNTYGFHSIHGRAPTFASGIKCANPDLSVWIITGDGDGLSIGGNHLIHVMRRNMDVNILLVNNRIYGLTKGQYSPTSEIGKKTKSSPMGSIDQPINPLCLAIAAEATFIARTLDSDVKHLGETLKKAAAHKGASFVEIYQNCVIFNNNAFQHITGKEERFNRMLYLEDGQPLIFGKDKNKAIVTEKMAPKIVDIDSVPKENLITHQSTGTPPHYAYMLTQLDYPTFPVPFGVFRKMNKPVYNEELNEQVELEIQNKGPGTLQELLHSGDTWTI